MSKSLYAPCTSKQKNNFQKHLPLAVLFPNIPHSRVTNKYRSPHISSVTDVQTPIHLYKLIWHVSIHHLSNGEWNCQSPGTSAYTPSTSVNTIHNTVQNLLTCSRPRRTHASTWPKVSYKRDRLLSFFIVFDKRRELCEMISSEHGLSFRLLVNWLVINDILLEKDKVWKQGKFTGNVWHRVFVRVVGWCGYLLTVNSYFPCCRQIEYVY